MRKIIFLFGMVMTLGAGVLSAEINKGVEPEFRPRLPELMAQGTSFTANSHGYGALFTNPAGFAAEDEGDITILSLTGALRVDPFQFWEDYSQSEYGSTSALITEVLSQQLSTNGIGAQTSAGVGFVGKGLGLGLITTLEADAQGKTQLGTEATSYLTLAAPLGYAYTLEPKEGYEVSVGGDLRPMLRVAVETSAADLLGTVAGGGGLDGLYDKPVRYGTALALDLGAILRIDGWRFGLSVRDLPGTEFFYSETKLGTLLEADGFNEGEANFQPPETVLGYGIPAVARAGVSYHWDLDLFVVSEPILHAEYEQPFIPKDSEGEPLAPGGSFFTHLNAGAEVKFVKFMSLQAGLTSGYLTGGLGVDLLFMELNVAGYTEEMGPHAGDNPASGATIELAFRI